MNIQSGLQTPTGLRATKVPQHQKGLMPLPHDVLLN